MTGDRFTPEQRAAAAFAAGALRVAGLTLKRAALNRSGLPAARNPWLDEMAERLFTEHDALVEIAGVTFANDAARRGGER